MKTKLLALLFAAALTSGAMAQSDSTYHLHHFLPDSAQFWSCDGLYIVAGDTVINGKKMKKIGDQRGYLYAIYEDVENAKYFYVDKGTTTEFSFMDFSVNEGESFIVDYFGDMILTVDSVRFDKDGRKMIYVKYKFDYDCWVEGIGSIYSILLPYPFGLTDSYIPPLKEVLVGDSIVYKRFADEQCKSFIPFISVNDKKSNTNISIYPNPAKDFLFIDAESLECCTYEIISTSGAVLQSGELLPSIDISHLARGLKLFAVKNDNGTVIYSGRFVKD